jgi:hypothetical protein
MFTPHPRKYYTADGSNRNVGIKLLLRLCIFVQVEQNDAILPTN